MRKILLVVVGLLAVAVLWWPRATAAPVPAGAGATTTAAAGDLERRAAARAAGENVPEPVRTDIAAHTRRLAIAVDERDSEAPVGGVEVKVLPRGEGWARGEREDAVQWDGSRVVRSTADAGGQVELEVPDGELQLVVATDRWHGTAIVPADATTATLHVSPVVGFHVLVVDEQRVPLADFPVEVRSKKGTQGARSDADGRAALSGLPMADAPFLVAPGGGWVGPDGGFPRVERSRPESDPVVLVVPPHGSVRLRLLENGAPPEAVEPDLRMSVTRHGGAERWSARVWTDVTGAEVVIAPVALGQRLSVRIGGDRRPRVTTVLDGPTRPGQEVVHVVELPPLPPPDPAVTFRVLAPDGSPLADHDVMVEVSRPGMRSGGPYRTDEAGVLRIELGRLGGRRGAPVERQIERIDAAAAPTADASDQLGLGGHLAVGRRVEPEEHLGDLRLESVPDLVSGRVVDERGRPLSGVAVTVHPAGGPFVFATPAIATRADGSFRVPGPPRFWLQSELVVRADREGHVRATSSPVALGGSVDVTLARGAEARVRFEDPETIERLNVEVAWLDAQGTELQARDVGRSNHAGAPWRWTDLPAGPATFVLRHRREPPFLSIGPIQLRAGEVTADPRLDGIRVADHVSTLTVRVLGIDGKPMSRAAVFRTHRGSTRALTDAAGEAVIPRAPRGASIDVTVFGAGVRPIRLKDVARDVEIRLEPAASLRLAVGGLPAGVESDALSVELAVDLDLPGLPSWRAAPDGDGVVTLALPPAGSYRAELIGTVDGRRRSLGTFADPVVVPEAPGDLEWTLEVDDAMRAKLGEAFGR